MTAWIDDVQLKWKHLWSVRWAAIGVVYATMGGVYIAMPSGLQPNLPEWTKMVLLFVGIGLASAPGIAATLKQPKLPAVIAKAKADAAIKDIKGKGVL